MDKHTDSDGKKSYSCIACGASRKGNAALDRVLGHATKCEAPKKTERELWMRPKQESGHSSIGAQLEKADSEAAKDSAPKQKGQSCLPGQLDIDKLRAVAKRKEKKDWEEFQSRYDHIVM